MRSGLTPVRFDHSSSCDSSLSLNPQPRSCRTGQGIGFRLTFKAWDRVSVRNWDRDSVRNWKVGSTEKKMRSGLTPVRFDHSSSCRSLLSSRSDMKNSCPAIICFFGGGWVGEG